jgi:ATP-dependent exoDNAse (exonuclease V) alpha subunit
LKKYHGSGLVRGIGPVTAKRIVKHFGLDTLEVIEHDIERLHQVDGGGAKRIEIIARNYIGAGLDPRREEKQRKQSKEERAEWFVPPVAASRRRGTLAPFWATTR